MVGFAPLPPVNTGGPGKPVIPGSLQQPQRAGGGRRNPVLKVGLGHSGEQETPRGNPSDHPNHE